MKISRFSFCSDLSNMMALVKAQATRPRNCSRLLQAAMVLAAGLMLCQAGWAQRKGINFPPTEGTSGNGAFSGGILTYNYTNQQIANSNSTFDTMRLAINVTTANDPDSLQKLKGYVDQFNGQNAIICMFGVEKPGEPHGDGFPDGLAAMGNAWYLINQVFSSYPNVHYEIFNEPFGYCPKNSNGGVDCGALTLAEKQHYVSDMETIITDAGMSTSNPKIILDAIGYASNVNDTVEGGWGGDIAYHFYYNWIGSPYTQSRYSNKAQADLGTYGQRVWVTEFGANLSGSNTCYDTYDGGTTAIDQNINTLRGLDDALRALKANGHRVKGALAFHGWNNGDSYDYWLAANSNGACKIREIEAND